MAKPGTISSTRVVEVSIQEVAPESITGACENPWFIKNRNKIEVNKAVKYIFFILEGKNLT